MSETVLPDDLDFHGNGGFYPPYGVITSSDHGPAVVVATWIMMCLMGLTVIARFGTRHSVGNKDSVAIGIACILAVVQSVTVHLAAGHGLGKHLKDLNPREYAYYEKVEDKALKAIMRSRLGLYID
ncbi:MAG: hypothetical protein Q9167_004772 [Letrouitia subvulpina]